MHSDQKVKFIMSCRTIVLNRKFVNSKMNGKEISSEVMNYY